MTGLLRSRWFHSLFGAAVSLGLIGWILAATEWRDVGEQLAEANFWMLIPIALLLTVHFLLRAWRWRHLLPGHCDAGIRSLFDSILVGAFATFILPLRAGEFVRPYLLTKYSRYSFSSAFVSVIVERFFDLSVVLFFFALVVLRVPAIPDWAQRGALAGFFLAVVILTIMLVGTYLPRHVLKLVDVFAAVLPPALRRRVHKFSSDFLEGAAVLSRGGRLPKVIGISFLIWGTCFLGFHLHFLLFHLAPSAWVSISVGVIIALAVAAPSAPGFIGVIQGACIVSFAMFGFSKEFAVAYSIVNHVFQYVVFVMYGVFVLVRDGLKFSELRQHASGSEPAEP